MTKTTLSLTGMTCASCEKLISLELSTQPGVAKALVSYNARAVVIDYDPQQVTVNHLVDAIRALGYQAKNIDEK